MSSLQCMEGRHQGQGYRSRPGGPDANPIIRKIIKTEGAEDLVRGALPARSTCLGAPTREQSEDIPCSLSKHLSSSRLLVCWGSTSLFLWGHDQSCLNWIVMFPTDVNHRPGACRRGAPPTCVPHLLAFRS
uniref:Uncharacterized protein n=1 Tax=Rousettus aegyptiacus TaxID=9407 RepID=A0A7J8F0K1_ROUAE|nr:hypothetical protein HJG63_012417 [Rousettus aegyptiacus]